MAKIKFNVLLAGQSGAGKSSFANYLLNNEIFTTGKGKPVTQWEENLQSHSFFQGDSEITVYDTVGIEVTNVQRWQAEMDRFIQEKSIENYHVSDGSFINQEYQNVDVLHGMFYVINSGCDRLQDVEVAVIKNFVDQRVPVYIILTNADTNPHKIQGLKETIATQVGDDIPTYEVISVAINKRNGTRTEKTGRQAVIDAFLPPAAKITSLAVLYDLYHTTYVYEAKVKQFLQDINPGMFNLPTYLQQIKELQNNPNVNISDLSNKITSAKELFQELDPNSDLDYYFSELDRLNDYMNDAVAEQLSEYKELSGLIAGGTGLLGILTGLLSLELGGIILTIKQVHSVFKDMKNNDMITEMCNNIRHEIKSIESELKNNK